MAHGGDAMSFDVSLALSLLFGVAQIALGGAVAVGLVRRGRWRTLSGYVLLLIALWFPFSGLGELIVSGLEVVRRLTATPSAATLVLWRGRVDTSLAALTIALLVALLAFPLVRWVADGVTKRSAPRRES